MPRQHLGQACILAYSGKKLNKLCWIAIIPQQGLGGRVRCVITGAAPISPVFSEKLELLTIIDYNLVHFGIYLKF